MGNFYLRDDNQWVPIQRFDRIVDPPSVFRLRQKGNTVIWHQQVPPGTGHPLRLKTSSGWAYVLDMDVFYDPTYSKVYVWAIPRAGSLWYAGAGTYLSEHEQSFRSVSAGLTFRTQRVIGKNYNDLRGCTYVAYDLQAVRSVPRALRPPDGKTWRPKELRLYGSWDSNLQVVNANGPYGPELVGSGRFAKVTMRDDVETELVGLDTERLYPEHVGVYGNDGAGNLIYTLDAPDNRVQPVETDWSAPSGDAGLSVTADPVETFFYSDNYLFPADVLTDDGPETVVFQMSCPAVAGTRADASGPNDGDWFVNYQASFNGAVLRAVFEAS